MLLPSSSARAVLLRARAPCIQQTRLASHEVPQYNEPTGWFLGQKTLPNGQKRVKESWENIWMVGMYGSMAVATVMLYYKPDTSVQTWALKEAKARMEARGEKYKYEPSTST
ncbi:Ndufb11, NADH dehydrogenase 1 beta subcomplex subunit [Mycena floridula]|nr:Ndufb11, NADH dehydrogenase 1 beta subcomplex subunit [Mycena floridula]